MFIGKIVVIGAPLSSPQVKSYHPLEAFPGSCQLGVIAPLLTGSCPASRRAQRQSSSDFSLHAQGLALSGFPSDQDSHEPVFCRAHTHECPRSPLLLSCEPQRPHTCVPPSTFPSLVCWTQYHSLQFTGEESEAQRGVLQPEKPHTGALADTCFPRPCLPLCCCTRGPLG